ncbi:MAG: outer membrane lipoprotein-sorting protein [Spartobacteria bacterium]|nr:outer membrane lipoprotein-sorting protein [Spartobacteria bacterium]
MKYSTKTSLFRSTLSLIVLYTVTLSGEAQPYDLTPLQQAIPQDSITLAATMESKNRRGKREATYLLDISLNLSSTTNSAMYVMRTPDGSETDRLIIHRDQNGHATYEYYKDGTDQPAPLPSPMDPIARTDFTWADLSMDFLWWPDAEYMGADTKLNRACAIVTLPVPTSVEGPTRLIKLWIDQASNALLQMEAYDGKGELLRKMEVVTLKKFGETYGVGDLEVRSYPDKHKTRLNISDMQQESDTDYIYSDPKLKSP